MSSTSVVVPQGSQPSCEDVRVGGVVAASAEPVELRTRSETELRFVAQTSGACERQELPLP